MSNFYSVHDNKEIIQEAISEVEVTTEGWGYVITRWLGGIVPNVVHLSVSMANLKNMLNNKELRNYIKKECDSLLKEEQKKDKSVTKKIPSGFINSLRSYFAGNGDMGFFHGARWSNWRTNLSEDSMFNTLVDDYNLTYFYDANHIDVAIVVFYSEAKDEFIGRRLKAPSSKELGKMFHREGKD